MLRGQPRGAERPVLLLRMLQDQQRQAIRDRHHLVADAQRKRFKAARTIRHRLGKNNINTSTSSSARVPNAVAA